MGVAYGELKKPQEAIDACKEAIKIKSDYHKAYYNMGENQWQNTYWQPLGK
jgi:tetratricopeptide (TPR) repeat protein